jgi:hypothetical protein
VPRAKDLAEVDQPQAEERWNLEKRKLELEIAHLSAPWWRSPSLLAPVATISVALLGFAWAATTGFFDVSRRELDIRKREVEIETRALIERRDEQTKRFRSEKAQQRLEIEHLQSTAKALAEDRDDQARRFKAETASQLQVIASSRAELASLTAKIKRLDEGAKVLVRERAEEAERFRGETAVWKRRVDDLQEEAGLLKKRVVAVGRPVLIGGKFTARTEKSGSAMVYVSLEGVNFDETKGTIEATDNGGSRATVYEPGGGTICTQSFAGEDASNVLGEITQWAPDVVVVRIKVKELAELEGAGCALHMRIRRADGQTSNYQTVDIPELRTEWFR